MPYDQNTKLTYTNEGNIVAIGTNNRSQNTNANPNYDCSPFLIITETINNKNVEKISDAAFRLHSNLQKVVIPKTVKTIGWDGFAYCNKLKEVTFQEGSQLESLEQGVFYQSHQLTIIRLPSSLSNINHYNFFINNLRYLIYCGDNSINNQHIFQSADETRSHFPQKIIVSYTYSHDNFGECNTLYKSYSCEIPVIDTSTKSKDSHFIISLSTLYTYILMK